MNSPAPIRSLCALGKPILLVMACLTFMSVSAIAQNNGQEPLQEDEKTVEKQLAEMLSLAPDDGFVYRREDRADPFAPFISEKMINAERNKAKEELTGLQRVEPGQLTLVAVIFNGKTAMAMAQDPGGMGYYIRQGMKIGLSGVVDAITTNTVIIKQKYQTISGKSRYRTIEMVLKKEGEK